MTNTKLCRIDFSTDCSFLAVPPSSAVIRCSLVLLLLGCQLRPSLVRAAVVVLAGVEAVDPLQYIARAANLLRECVA